MGCDLWLLDTGANGHFTYDPRLLENSAECSTVLRCAGGNTFPIVGTGTSRLSLRSGEGVICVTLMNVSHVPGLSHHILSLRRIADEGNKYIGTREGIRIVFAKSSDQLFAPSCGQLNGLFSYRTDRSSEANVHAVIAPGPRPTPSTAADINEFYCSHCHIHEDLLRKTAKQIGVKLQGQLTALSRVLGGERDQEACQTIHLHSSRFCRPIGAEVRKVTGGKGLHDDSER